jgi:hypothetical protein
MYFNFSFLCECEELKSFIVVCVYSLFCDCFPLLEHEHGITVGVRLFKYWKAICKLLQRNLKLDQPTIGGEAFQGIPVKKSEEKYFETSCYRARSPLDFVDSETELFWFSLTSLGPTTKMFRSLVTPRTHRNHDRKVNQPRKCFGFFFFLREKK